MRKLIKRTIWVLVSIIGIVIILAAFLLVQIIKMSPLESGQITDNIYALKDTFVNMYVVKCEDRYIVFDGGSRSAHISKELNKLSINPQAVSHAFLTHSDWDHTGALDLFTNARIFLAKAEETMINGETARFLIQKNKLKFTYQTLEDNQIIEVGKHRVMGILTPGHTPGSMCYLLDGIYLFSGDNMRLKKGKVVNFNKFFNMDTKKQLQSLKKIKNIPTIKYIFTAHYGFTKNIQTAFADF